MNHNDDKNLFEYLVKNMLQKHNLVDKNLYKNERPDFRNDKIGLEITRADQTLRFNGLISKYDKNNITDIEGFNEEFKEAGGRVLKKNRSTS